MADWTDKRMDDLADQVKTGFARVDRELKDIHGEFKSVRGEIANLRTELKTEMDKGFERIDKRFDRLHHWTLAIAVALLGMVGADLARGFGG